MRNIRSHATSQRRANAPVFAALGDGTRLWLLARLSRGNRFSISHLTEGSKLTRQAITKHLRVLREVGAVEVRDLGRQRLYRINVEALRPIHDWIGNYERLWSDRFDQLDLVLENLKAKEQENVDDE